MAPLYSQSSIASLNARRAGLHEPRTQARRLPSEHHKDDPLRSFGYLLDKAQNNTLKSIGRGDEEQARGPIDDLRPGRHHRAALMTDIVYPSSPQTAAQTPVSS